MRLGILTGGGDCPGLNAVIQAVVRTAVDNYRWDVMGIRDGFYGLVTGKVHTLTLDDVASILHEGGTILGSSNRDNPFKFRKVIKGQVQYVDASAECVANMNEHGIDALIVVGGDGTQSIAHKFHQMGIKVVSVPKTIDNDLPATDITFGFDTAVNTAMEAIDRIRTTAESHHRVMIVEVMGRDAGWIALQSGISGGAHVILIPEIPYDIDRVVAKIYERKSRGKHYSIVVVAEGAKPKGGAQVVKQVVKEDQSNPIRLGGIGEFVRDQIEQLTQIESRVTVLGHIQRGGSPSSFDRVLATRYGAAAAEAVKNGKFGHMVCLRTPNIEAVPLEQAIGSIRTVPTQGGTIHAARLIGINVGD